MKHYMSRADFAAGVLVTTIFALSVTTIFAQEPDWEVHFTIAVPLDRMSNVVTSITSDPRYRGCSQLASGYARFDFAAHLKPFPGTLPVARRPYSTSYFACRPANIQHYHLFNEKVAEYALTDATYHARLLVDTEKTPHAACPRKYCGADGLFHHTNGEPCAYC